MAASSGEAPRPRPRQGLAPCAVHIRCGLSPTRAWPALCPRTCAKSSRHRHSSTRRSRRSCHNTCHPLAAWWTWRRRASSRRRSSRLLNSPHSFPRPLCSPQPGCTARRPSRCPTAATQCALRRSHGRQGARHHRHPRRRSARSTQMRRFVHPSAAPRRRSSLHPASSRRRRCAGHRCTHSPLRLMLLLRQWPSPPPRRAHLPRT
mmetsp:Transcript_18319/g.47218  ORF Transcript_18319/g.47218 Transcript_18319/m.47218 type:complete len:205 (+) Transcript_18319:145-759(+)